MRSFRPIALRRAPILIGLASAAAAVLGSAAQTPAPPGMVASGSGPEARFLSENTAAMNKMMADMEIKPTGDIDADFTAMMIPHHQGAIDMAIAELRYGKNEQLRRIAQEIIVGQQQEIVAMRLALRQPLPAPAPAPTQVSPSDQPSGMATHHHQTDHGAPSSPAPTIDMK
jgi:DUF305 family protein family protein